MEPNSLPVTPKRWQLLMRFDGIPVLSLSLCRPMFPGSGRTARIERYFSQLEAQWKAHWTQKLYPAACQAWKSAMERSAPFTPWRAELEYTVTLWRAPLLSLRLDAAEGDFSAKPLRMRMGETWDCETGYPRTLRSFFPPKQHFWRGQLLEQIRSDVQRRLASGESLLDADCEAAIKRTFDPERFYLTEDGAEIFYPLYVLGPYAEGIPAFPIQLP